MTDIVDWLESEAAFYFEVQDIETKQKFDKAKAEIERLRKALERIDKMKAFPDEDGRDVLYAKIGIMRDIARDALEGK